MSGSTRETPGRPVRAQVFRVLNVPVRLVLGLPVPVPLGRHLMLAHITGRTTGKVYRQPLSYVRDAGVLLTPGGGRWTLNLAPGTPVRLRVRGQDVSAVPEVVADVDQAGELLRTVAAANPVAAWFTGIPREPDGSFRRSGLEQAVNSGFRVVRWHPAGS